MENSKPKTIDCRHFTWRLRQRNGLWQADSRGNNRLKGRRYSLGTSDWNEAKSLLHELDEKMAQDHGLIRRRDTFESGEFKLSVEEGLEFYLKHIQRPRAAKGPKEETRKRYGRIIRAFQKFLIEKRIQFWEQIDKSLLDEYGAFRSNTCKQSTVSLELNQIRTILNFFRDERLMSPGTAFKYPVRRQSRSSRYCPRPVEVGAIVEQLRGKASSKWLHDAVMLLAYTGLRLGEAAQLTSHDVDLENSVINVVDEAGDNESGKTTKSGHSRLVPVHPALMPVLKGLVTTDDRQLFKGPRGGRLSSETFGKCLRMLALVPLSDRFPHTKFQKITAHCFRHFFNSICADSGISSRTVECMMGHQTDSMSRRYYHGRVAAALENVRKIKPFTNIENDTM